MATTKTLRPTNVTISIPEFTDQPDQRVNSNCIDKSADAINTLSEQIGALNTALNYYTMLTKTNITSSYVSYTLSNSKKFSEYEWIVFAVYNGNWCVGTCTIPRSVFISDTGCAVFTGGATPVEVDFKYTSDTKVDIKVITTSTSTYSVKIFGMKNG